MTKGSAGFWDLTDKNFILLDATNKSLGVFTGLSGGDMSISMIPYTVVGANGGPIEKYIPGQISFAPITLTCNLADVVIELTKWFELSEAGDYDKALLRNCTIGAYQPSMPDLFVVQWDLINVIPTTIPTFFYYNAYQDAKSIKFKLTLQPEDIKISYQQPKPPPPPDEDQTA